MFGFEKLFVWQKAVEFANNIYAATKNYPKEEVFGLTGQLRRASVSIGCNVAEGSGRASKKDFAHFLSMSYGSLCEVITLLRISLDQGFLPASTHHDLYHAEKNSAGC